MATCGVWCLVLLTLSVGSLSSAGPTGQNWSKYSISCRTYITYHLMFGGEEEEQEEERDREGEREREILIYKGNR